MLSVDCFYSGFTSLKGDKKEPLVGWNKQLYVKVSGHFSTCSNNHVVEADGCKIKSSVPYTNLIPP